MRLVARLEAWHSETSCSQGSHYEHGRNPVEINGTRFEKTDERQSLHFDLVNWGIIKSSISLCWFARRCVRNSIFVVYEIVMTKSTGANDLFSERLRAARTQRGLSQGGLAKRAGLQPSAVSHFETGLRKPSYENLRRVADALDVTTDFLLGRVLEMKGLASGDPLFHDIERLTSDDRDLAIDFVKLLADRVRRREP